MSRNKAKDKKLMLEKLRKMPIVELACRQISLSRATYYRWRKEDEKFATACDEAIEQSAGKINDLAESQLISSIKEKNMTAIIFWLKHHHPMYEARLRLEGRIKHETEVLTPSQEKLVAKALSMVGLLPGSIEQDNDNEEKDHDKTTRQ